MKNKWEGYSFGLNYLKKYKALTSPSQGLYQLVSGIPLAHATSVDKYLC